MKHLRKFRVRVSSRYIDYQISPWEEWTHPLFKIYWVGHYFCPAGGRHWWNDICGADINFYKWNLYIGWQE